MRFKIDENLPLDSASILRDIGFDADTVKDESLSGADDSVNSEQCKVEGRVLLTLDLDFADIRRYPPGEHPGIIVFRPQDQSKPTVISLLRRLILVLENKSPERRLWIAEHDRIRYRL